MKKFKITLLAFLVLLQFTPIHAASIGISGPTSIPLNGTGSISINSPNSSTQGTINNSNNGVVQVLSDGKSVTSSKFIFENGSGSINLKAVAAGTATIKIVSSGFSDSGDPLTGVTKVFTITVPEPAPPVTEKPAPPAVEQPKPPVVDNTEKEKTPEQKQKAKEAAEAAELEREALELALRQATPLIDSIEIISESDKFNKEVLHKFVTEKDLFEYEYVLPKRVDKVSLNAVKAVDSASFNVEEVYEIGEGESSKVIELNLVDGEVEQTIKITLKKDDTPDVITEFNGKPLRVYQDELLDPFMIEKGFKVASFEVDEVKSMYYELGSIKLQLLVNDEKVASWHTLNEGNVIQEEIVMLQGPDEQVFFVKEANEELSDKRLYSKKYTEKTSAQLDLLAVIDPELSILSAYKSWDNEEDEIVFGYDKSAEEGLYFIDKEVNSKFAVVAFDQKASTVTQTIAIASSVGLVTVSGYVLATTLMNIRKRKED